MSLRIGVLTHVVCDCCGRRCRVKSMIPDDHVGMYLQLRCSLQSCIGETAMSIGSYRAYDGIARRLDIEAVRTLRR